MVGPRGFEPLTFCTPKCPAWKSRKGGKRRLPAFTGVRRFCLTCRNAAISRRVLIGVLWLIPSFSGGCCFVSPAGTRRREVVQPCGEGDDRRRIIFMASRSLISRCLGMDSITPVMTLRYTSWSAPWRTNTAPSSAMRRRRTTRFMRTPSRRQIAGPPTMCRRRSSP